MSWHVLVNMGGLYELYELVCVLVNMGGLHV